MIGNLGAGGHAFVAAGVFVEALTNEGNSGAGRAMNDY